MIHEEDIKRLTSTRDKSFIVVLDRMANQAIDAVRKSEPCVESQHNDGVRIGRLYMIQEVIKAFKEF